MKNFITTMLILVAFYSTLDAQTKIANFQEDFNLSPNSGNWKYYWNQPDNWQAGINSGDLSSGAIGTISSYTPLVSAGTMLSADGDLNHANSSPDAWMRLGKTGCHPGSSGTNPLLDRYIIAAYTISAPGNYYILNSYLNNPDTRGNGILVNIHVNSRTALIKNISPPGNQTFDVSLGELVAGDVIYVCFGANGNFAYDFFNMDFDISMVDIQTKMGNFQEDFNLSQNSGNWKYYWNQPDNWQAGINSGDLSSGAIGTVSSYTPLVSTGKMLSADGDLNPANGSPDSFIRLGKTGCHPGSSGTNTLLDRYIITAYTVTTPGNYYILNSSLKIPDTRGNGLLVNIHVNSRTALYRNIALPGDRTFDVYIGKLVAGDVIYVGFGANGNKNYDTFEMDFDISIVDNQIKMANFQEDFNVSSNYGNWKYYWNQPDNWQAGINLGDLSSGAIGTISSYKPLVSSGTMLSADGDLNHANSAPDRWMRLGRTGCLPGSSGTNTLLDRYIIAAYTVSAPGNYYILNSYLNNPDTRGNGILVNIHVNSRKPALIRNISPSTDWTFDVSLGELVAGDVIYVGFGANGNSAYDGFSMDFDISIVDKVETHEYCVSNYGAIGNGSTDDSAAIKNAVLDFSNDPFPSSLYFDNKSYRIATGGKLFDLRGVKNKTIYGNGAELIGTPGGLGLWIDDSENVLVKDLKFDSDPLSWTQGVITAVNPAAKTFTMTVDEGYPIPTNNYGDLRRDHPWGMVWEPSEYTIKNELVYIASSQASGNSVVFTVRDDYLSALNTMIVNDRFTIDTFGVGGTLNQITSSSNITFENIIIYAARSLNFVISNNLGAIHMDGIQMRRKPNTNRLLSGYRDGFHCKGNKVGPLIENCYVEGICDDAINLHAYYLYVTAAASPTAFTLSTNINFEIGDTLQFYDMNAGIELGKTQIATISGSSITTTSPIIGVVAGAPKVKTTTFLINLSKANSGFIIRNNTFYNHRRFSMLISAQNGLIENNIGEKTSGIALINDLYWFNGPEPSNIVIRNNSFRNTRGKPLMAKFNSFNRSSQDPLIKNIVLQNNTFGPSRNGSAASTFADIENLRLQGNKFVNDVGSDPISFTNSRAVTLCENTYNELPMGTLTLNISADDITAANMVFNCFSKRPNEKKFTNEEILTNVAIYKTDNAKLRIAGLAHGKATIQIFTILGIQVLHESFIVTGTTNVTLPEFSRGIYLVKIQNKEGLLLKKIFLE